MLTIRLILAHYKLRKAQRALARDKAKRIEINRNHLKRREAGKRGWITRTQFHREAGGANNAPASN